VVAILEQTFRDEWGRVLAALIGFLGDFELAEEADHAREDAAPLVAEDLLEDRYHSTIGRTSTAPPRRAAGIRAASSIAASRLSASNTR
jgi:hypothetical protein